MQVTDKTDDMLGLSVREFVAAAAAKTPTPGGGSVAGTVGALAVALGEMALNFTMGKKKFAQHEAAHARLSGRMARARAMFLDLVSDDMAAYGMYREAAGMEAGPEKDQSTQLALAAAINVPREMTKLTLAVMEDLHSLCDKCNPYLISDLLAGAALGVATIRLCDYNVRINVPQLAEKTEARDIRAASKADLDKADRLLVTIETAASEYLK